MMKAPPIEPSETVDAGGAPGDHTDWLIRFCLGKVGAQVMGVIGH